MSITALPTPPTRSDPASFAERGDAFMSALPTLVTEANALAAEMNENLQLSLAAVTTTSADSIEISSGNKSMTVETGLGLVVGMNIKAASTASPENYMIGVITGYNANTGALAFDVTATGGSGTLSAWTISPALTLQPEANILPLYNAITLGGL